MSYETEMALHESDSAENQAHLDGTLVNGGSFETNEHDRRTPHVSRDELDIELRWLLVNENN